FKFELLTWLGIVGGALTLFTNISATLKLADWARLLVQGWKEWTHAFWLWAFGWLGIHLPPEWTPVLSFLLFGSLLTIGQAFKFRRTIKDQLIVDKSQERSFQLISWHTLFCLAFMLIGVLLYAVSYVLHLDNPGGPISKVTIHVFSISSMFIVPPVSMVLFARHRLHAALSVFLITIFFVIIALAQLLSMDAGPAAGLSAIAMTSVLPLVLLSVAPVKAVNRRLIFLAIGLI